MPLKNKCDKCGSRTKTTNVPAGKRDKFYCACCDGELFSIAFDTVEPGDPEYWLTRHPAWSKFEIAEWKDTYVDKNGEYKSYGY